MGKKTIGEVLVQGQRTANTLSSVQVGLQAVMAARLGEQSALMRAQLGSLDEIAEYQKVAAAASLEQAHLASARAAEERSRAAQFDNSAAALHEYGIELHRIAKRASGAGEDQAPRLWLDLQLLKRRSSWMAPTSVDPAQRGDLTKLHTGLADVDEDLEQLAAETIAALQQWVTLTDQHNGLLFRLQHACDALEAQRNQRGDKTPVPADFQTAQNQLEGTEAEIQRWQQVRPKPLGEDVRKFYQMAQKGSFKKAPPVFAAASNEQVIQEAHDAQREFEADGKPMWLLTQFTYPRIDRNFGICAILLLLYGFGLLLAIVGLVLGEKYFKRIARIERLDGLCQWQLSAGQQEATALRNVASAYGGLDHWLANAQQGMLMYQLAASSPDHSRAVLDVSLAG